MAGKGNVYVSSTQVVGDGVLRVFVGFDIAFDYGGYNETGGATWGIQCDGQSRSGNARFNIPNGNGSWQWANIAYNQSFDISLTGVSRSIYIKGYCNTGVNPSYIEHAINYQVPAREYIPHGDPSLSASKSVANYGEPINLTWAKSSTQGNAKFDRFELWQGSKMLYSGTGTSMQVVPSSVTGAQGGTVAYVLKEIHEWYGSYRVQQTEITITVRSGVVTAYDSRGTKHVGLVSAYDASGKQHYVLITAYDSGGKPHNVV